MFEVLTHDGEWISIEAETYSHDDNTGYTHFRVDGTKVASVRFPEVVERKDD